MKTYPGIIVRQQRIGDCFEIHILHKGLCDLVLSGHQNVLLEVWLCQCVSCKEPLLSWSSCKCRSFGSSGSECKCCAHPVQLFSAALKLTHEKSSRVRPCVLELFRPQVFLLILLTILAYHATGLSVPTRCPHVYQCFRFLLVLATGLTRADLLVLSPRVVAGRNTETTESCGHDVGDVGVVGPKEPVDKPGTTIGT